MIFFHYQVSQTYQVTNLNDIKQKGDIKVHPTSSEYWRQTQILFREPRYTNAICF